MAWKKKWTASRGNEGDMIDQSEFIILDHTLQQI